MNRDHKFKVYRINRGKIKYIVYDFREEKHGANKKKQVLKNVILKEDHNMLKDSIM